MSPFYIHKLNRIQFLLLNASAVQLKQSQQINNGKNMVSGLISKAVQISGQINLKRVATIYSFLQFFQNKTGCL